MPVQMRYRLPGAISTGHLNTCSFQIHTLILLKITDTMDLDGTKIQQLHDPTSPFKTNPIQAGI